MTPTQVCVVLGLDEVHRVVVSRESAPRAQRRAEAKGKPKLRKVGLG